MRRKGLWSGAIAVQVAAAIVLSAVTISVAKQKEAKDPWLGKRVITQYGTVLKAVVDDEDRGNNLDLGHERELFLVYRVEQVKLPWLRLVAEKSGDRGWTKVEHVIHYENAVDSITSQIRGNPQNPNLYIRRGNVRQDRKEYDLAIDDYTEAIRLDPKEAMAFYNRASVWDDKKEYDKAIADYSETIRLDPKSVYAYNGRGIVWNYKKEYDKAIDDYSKAIRIDPKSLYAYNNRALLWSTCPDEKYRDGKKAVESATKACELSEWRVSDALDTLAASYAESGDFDAAVKWQQKAINLLPKEDQVRRADFASRLALYRDKKPYRVR